MASAQVNGCGAQLRAFVLDVGHDLKTGGLLAEVPAEHRLGFGATVTFVLHDDLLLSDLLKSDRQRLVAVHVVDQGPNELMESLAQLVVVRIDLTRAAGGQVNKRVLAVDLGQ